ncbi:MAG TPA: hypothetical protein VHO91_08525 [Rhodopila sp.]|nr:hypothetical protein [Rhodopila sp.]
MQLALSVWAMLAWGGVWQDQAPSTLKWAAGASACWFAMAAVIVGFIFDFWLSRSGPASA